MEQLNIKSQDIKRIFPEKGRCIWETPAINAGFYGEYEDCRRCENPGECDRYKDAMEFGD